MSNTSTPPETAVTSLPVLASVKDSYRLVFTNLWAVPAAVLLPALLYLVWYLFATYSGVAAIGSGEVHIVTLLLMLPALFIQILATTLLYVAWHRFTLLGPVAGRPKYLYGLARRHWRYLGNILLVFMIIFFTIFVLAITLRFLLPQVAVVLLVVTAYFALLIKFSFVFPAIAVDENYGIRNAWKQSNGQELRLAAGFFLCLLPALLLWFLLNWDLIMQILANQQPQVAPRSFLLSAFVTGFTILNGLVVMSFLSIAFATCTGWVPAAPDSRELEPLE